MQVLLQECIIINVGSQSVLKLQSTGKSSALFYSAEKQRSGGVVNLTLTSYKETDVCDYHYILSPFHNMSYSSTVNVSHLDYPKHIKYLKI